MCVCVFVCVCVCVRAWFCARTHARVGLACECMSVGVYTLSAHLAASECVCLFVRARACETIRIGLYCTAVRARTRVCVCVCVGLRLACEAACARMLAPPRMHMQMHPHTCTPCIDPHSCACVRAHVCVHAGESGRERAAAGVVPAWLRVAARAYVRVPLCARVDARVSA